VARAGEGAGRSFIYVDGSEGLRRQPSYFPELKVLLGKNRFLEYPSPVATRYRVARIVQIEGIEFSKYGSRN